MIASKEEIRTRKKLEKIDIDILVNKLSSIETFIRGSYTNNKFQNRNIKFYAESEGNKLYSVHPYLRVNDTIEIASGPNTGLYVIKSITNEYIELDKELFNFDCNYIIKIEYPLDVKDGCLDILEWEFGAKNKVGIKSESLSRHSVTYEDSSTFIDGYPVSLLGFLEPYRQMRF